MVRRYLIPTIITLLVVGVYNFVNIRLFSLDINKQVRGSLFRVFKYPTMDESIILLNIGTLSLDELRDKVDSLVLCYPRTIGINLCHYEENTSDFIKHFKEKNSVVIASCSNEGSRSLSSFINPDNSVTHFRTDRKDYFEFKIDHFVSRGNDFELIDFFNPRKSFYRWELSDVPIAPEYFQGKTVLIGYMGDYLTDSVYYFSNAG